MGFPPREGLQLPSSPGMPGCFPRGAGGGSPGDNGSHYNRCPCDPGARSKGNGKKLHFIIARANVEPRFLENFTNPLEILLLSPTSLKPLYQIRYDSTLWRCLCNCRHVKLYWLIRCCKNRASCYDWDSIPFETLAPKTSAACNHDMDSSSISVPREHAKITQHNLTFNQTVSRCMGGNKDACKVKERVEVMDLAGKGGGWRTEREQESKMSSMWKEGQGQGCVGQGDLQGHI